MPAMHSVTGQILQRLLTGCCVTYKGHSAFSCPLGTARLRMPESHTSNQTVVENRVQHAHLLSLKVTAQKLTCKAYAEHSK